MADNPDPDLTDEQKKQDRTERTELAADRTMLADERTLEAGWRTATAGLATAIGLVGLFREADPKWLVRVAATLLVIFSVAVIAFAYQRYWKAARRIESENVRSVSRFSLRLGSALLCAAAAAVGALVWLL